MEIRCVWNEQHLCRHGVVVATEIPEGTDTPLVCYICLPLSFINLIIYFKDTSLRTPTWKCGSTASRVIKVVVSVVLNASRMGDWLAHPASLLA